MLQVLVCTIGTEGIQRVCATPRPQVSGVEYLICWQQPHGPIPIPDELKTRSDVRILTHSSSGLSRNRNFAMERATAPFCLIGDDDVAYDAVGLENLIKAFQANPKTDIICTRYTCNGEYIKPYGSTPFFINKAPKGWYATSFEIAYRRESRAGNTRFCEQLGLGVPLLKAGEEDIWICDSLRAGASGICLPIDIGTHDHPTTSERHASQDWLIMTHGAVLSHIHPFTWPLRCIVHSMRQNDKTIISYLLLCLKGAAYARRHRIFRNSTPSNP